MTDALVAAAKSNARRAAREARAAVRDPAGASRAIGEIVLGSDLIPSGAIIAGYAAIGSEADPAALLEALHARGHAIVLPRVAGRDRPLVFHRWQPGDTLSPGAFGIPEPPASAPEARPDLVFVPALAVDAAGYRLGYGGGFYDRTLAALRGQGGAVYALGLAFAAQRVQLLPREATDIPLDALATEAGIIRFERAA